MFKNLFNSRKPKGGKRRDPLEYSRKMLQQQRGAAARSMRLSNETQRLLRNLQQQRQQSQRGLDAVKQWRELQQKQQLDRIEEGIRTRQAEARQRLMQPFNPPIPYEPPEPFQPPIPHVPPPRWGD